MEHEPISISDQNDDEVEDGELSTSDDGYNILERPDARQEIPSIATTSTKMEENSDNDEYLINESSDTSDSDNTTFNTTKKRKSLNTQSSIHVKPMNQLMKNPTRSKYNIWSTVVQEEDLEQSLQGCDVTNDRALYSRDVESYDFRLKYRLNGENCLKRRQSSEDDSEPNFNGTSTKRFRGNSYKSRNRFKKQCIKSRLGIRVSDDSSNSNSNDGIKNKIRREILDLAITEDNYDEEIATDIANKLYEEKEELLLRIINIIGRKLPIEIFKETQQIERDGGMMIMNNQRRRTPGGVFFHLIKNRVSHEHKNLIFSEERKISLKEKKLQQTKNRDQKVEELKKSLKIDKDLPKLGTRKELVMSHLKPESMSNPPPSPVTDGNRENSSDYDTHNIQHVNVASPEKLNSSKESDILQTYDDDFLDMNCDDMELF